jgi:uncharacterized protein YutE (UPF0331/DUF86 family)
MTEPLREDQLERVVTAVETIEESVGVLSEKRGVDRAAYKRDAETQDVVERRFVKATEAALDIGDVLLTHERGQPAASNPETMRSLGEAGVLTDTTATEMANAARFRNVLAHTYGDAIDHDVVYDALQDLDRYRSFVREVRTYLRSVDAV